MSYAMCDIVNTYTSPCPVNACHVITNYKNNSPITNFIFILCLF